MQWNLAGYAINFFVDFPFELLWTLVLGVWTSDRLSQQASSVDSGRNTGIQIKYLDFI